MQLFFSHETIRESQKELVDEIINCLENKKNLIANAPTGLGKTSAALSPCLSFALENKKTVIFITPKHTQHKIAIETLKQIKEKHNLNFIVVDLIGKKHMCAQPGVTEMHQTEFSDYCKHMVENKMCDYYNNIKSEHKLSLQTEITVKELSKSILHVEELKDISSKNKLCPFEVSMILAEKAKVIIADYNHILNPSIRDTILKKLNKDLSDLIIIIDEAHNIPAKCRDLLSSQLSTQMIEYAAKEASSLKYAEISQDILVLKEILEKLSRVKTTITDKESLISKEDFMKELTSKFDYDELLNNILFISEGMAELKKRSACKSIVAFLINWQGPDLAFSRILTKSFTNKGRVVITLNYKCLDPSLIIKPIGNNSYSSIFMSGTLNPVEMYKDLFGVEAKTIDLKNPFPKNNKLSIIIPDTTTKFTARTEDMFEKISSYCANITNIIPGNTIIFFPSYDIRDRVNKYFSNKCEKTILLESSELTKEEKMELIEKLKQYKTHGAVLLAAASGSIGEGLDFPDNLLKSVIVVGIPLDRPDLETKELIRYYDIKFNKGWDYGYIMPAIVRCLQNAGRCIRSETDKGVIVYLDSRYIWDSYFKCFPKDLYLKITKDPLPKIKEFFDDHNL